MDWGHTCSTMQVQCQSSVVRTEHNQKNKLLIYCSINVPTLKTLVIRYSQPYGLCEKLCQLVKALSGCLMSAPGFSLT